MSKAIVDDEESDFTADEFDPAVDAGAAGPGEASDARRRIEELMERRRLKTLLDDPYRDIFDNEF